MEIMFATCLRSSSSSQWQTTCEQNCMYFPSSSSAKFNGAICIISNFLVFSCFPFNFLYRIANFQQTNRFVDVVNVFVVICCFDKWILCFDSVLLEALIIFGTGGPINPIALKWYCAATIDEIILSSTPSDYLLQLIIWFALSHAKPIATWKRR